MDGSARQLLLSNLFTDRAQLSIQQYRPLNNIAGYYVHLDNCTYQESYGATRVNNNTDVRQQFNATDEELVLRIPVQNMG